MSLRNDLTKLLDDADVPSCYDDGTAMSLLERVQFLTDATMRQQEHIIRLEDQENARIQSAYDAEMLIVEALNEAGAPRYVSPRRGEDTKLSIVQRIRVLAKRAKQAAKS